MSSISYSEDNNFPRLLGSSPVGCECLTHWSSLIHSRLGSTLLHIRTCFHCIVGERYVSGPGRMLFRRDERLGIKTSSRAGRSETVTNRAESEAARELGSVQVLARCRDHMEIEEQEGADVFGKQGNTPGNRCFRRPPSKFQGLTPSQDRLYCQLTRGVVDW